MITLKPYERHLHRVLRERAVAANPSDPNSALLTYADLGRLADPEGSRSSGPQPNTRPPFRGLNWALGHISWYEHDHGRPFLSALVVNAETRQPGEGFTDLARQRGITIADPEAFWQEQVAAVVAFWADGPDPVFLADAALDRIIASLDEVRSRLPRPR